MTRPIKSSTESSSSTKSATAVLAGRIRKPRATIENSIVIPESLRGKVNHASKNPNSRVFRLSGIRSSSVQVPLNVVKAAERCLRDWIQTSKSIADTHPLHLGNYTCQLATLVQLKHNNGSDPIYVSLGTLYEVSQLEESTVAME